MNALPPLPLADVAEPVALAALVAGARCDVLTRTIPNWVSAVVAIAGLLLRTFEGDARLALIVAAATFSALWLLWLCGAMGGGDVKLITACTLLVAPWRVPSLIAAIVFAGGVLAAIYLVLRWARPASRPHAYARDIGTAIRLLRVERWRARRGAGIPYGCAIAAGALTVLVGGWSS